MHNDFFDFLLEDEDSVIAGCLPLALRFLIGTWLSLVWLALAWWGLSFLTLSLRIWRLGA